MNMVINMYEWKKTDPRLDINKRSRIVILRPDGEIGAAYVDTKEVCCILTSFKDYKHIGIDDKWDPSWYWIFTPNKD